MRFENEMDWFGLEMVAAEEIMNGEKLPVVIVNQLAQQFNCAKSIVQIAVHEFQESVREFEWCDKKGHKLVGDSYGGPEHGYDGAYCTRCGYSFGSILY